MYYVLAVVFFLTILAGLLNGLFFYLKGKASLPIVKIYFAWLALYVLFIIFGTGPQRERSFDVDSSPYKLPWQAEVSQWVSQGNRSLISHRGLHQNAWDFWMPVGTEILAAREGNVIKVEESFIGIGMHSNFITIEHPDGTRALYAHIKKDGVVPTVGDYVKQGQLIAYSGMVGQTINPHLHFVVLNKDESESLPIVFSDCSGGVPLAGRFYESGNALKLRK